MVTFDSATYKETMPTKLQAGEQIDILYAASWDFDTVAMADSGAFYPLDDLLDAYGQNTKAMFRDEIWESIRMKDGNIYLVPTLKDNCYLIGLTYNDTLASAIGVDFESTNFSSYFEMEDFWMNALELRDEKFPEYKGVPLVNDNRKSFIPYFFKLERLIPSNAIAVTNIQGYEVEPSRGEDEVYNFYESDKFREYCLMVQRLVENGIFKHPDDETNYIYSPGVLHRSGWGYTYVNEHQYGEDFVTKLKMLDGVWTDSTNFSSCSTAIGANCKDPERAMMVIDLLNSDPELATLLRFGIEGVHWEYDNDGKMQVSGRNADVENQGWLHWYGIYFGNLTITNAPESHAGPDNVMLTRMAEYNDNAILASHMGLTIDVSNISNEIAACNNVIAEYGYLLQGSLESQDAVNKAVDEFVAKLKANGSDKIVQEVQAQVDAFVAAQ